MARWYDYLIPYGVTNREREEQANAVRNHMGVAPGEEVGVMPAGTMAYDDAGNEIGFRKEAESYSDGYGLLANEGVDPTRLRLAADLMEQGSPVANQMLMSEMQNAQSLDNLNLSMETTRKKMQQHKDNIQAARSGMKPGAQPAQAPNPNTNIAPAPNVAFGTSSFNVSNTNPQGQPITPVKTAPIKPTGPMDARYNPVTGYAAKPQLTKEQQAQQVMDAYNAEIMVADKDTADKLTKIRDSEIDMIFGKNDVNLKRRTDFINADRAKRGLPPVSAEEVLKLGTVTAGQYQQTPLTAEQMKIWGLNPNFKYAWDQSGKPVRVDTHDKASDTEAKGSADIATALSTLYRLEELSTDNPELYGLYGDFNKLRKDGSFTGNMLDFALNAFGQPLSPGTVEALSKAMIANNSILAAVRGAAVGPEEQIMFERQLPVPGQPKDMYTFNLRATIENLEIVETVKKRAKTGAALKSYNIPVGKLINGAVYVGGDPKDENSWYKKRYLNK